MNNLEINYLSLIDFKLYISEEVFDNYFENLIDAMQTLINN